jgi:hypothetical protein
MNPRKPSAIIRTTRTTALCALALGGAFAVGGCPNEADNCENFNTCDGTGATGGSGAQGGGGAGGGTPAECVPSEAQGPVDDGCGIFVAPSGNDDTGLGTKASPYATIGKGLAETTGKPIYLCADAFTETVVITEGVDIFGGLDCAADWSWVGQTTKTALTSMAGAIPLSVTAAGSGSHITDLAITAAAGTQGTGESSIAALVDQAEVLFDRCELTAQAGADGAVGDTPPGRGDDGVKGPDGVVGCQGTALVIPLDAATVTCTTGGTSTGGLGGVGTANTNGGAGSDGESNPAVSSPAVNGSAGQTTSGQPGTGTQGADGAPGGPGAGATGIGTIDSTVGYVGVPGQDGQGNGSPAQGGGAGGGARGSVACTNGSFAGPAGGGGGTGGCGGLPGSGGGAGGSSIALISLNATVTFTACSLTAASGGTGGQGSPGQEGGNGLGGGLPGSGNNNNSGAGVRRRRGALAHRHDLLARHARRGRPGRRQPRARRRKRAELPEPRLRVRHLHERLKRLVEHRKRPASGPGREPGAWTAAVRGGAS